VKYIRQFIQFLKEVRTEVKKVTWPTKNETINITIVVIIGILILSVFLSLVDALLSTYVRWVLAASYGQFAVTTAVIVAAILGIVAFRWYQKKGRNI